MNTLSNRPALPAEIARRRTFAIISHPDAGKTTLTEKFLLFGGAIQMAGQVRAKGELRDQGAFTADGSRDGVERTVHCIWMSAVSQSPWSVHLVDTPRGKKQELVLPRFANIC